MVCVDGGKQNGAAYVAQCATSAVIFRAMGKKGRGKMNNFA